MDIEVFVKKRPTLYHLTDKRNLEHILAEGFKSTKALVEEAKLKNGKEFLTSRRPDHYELKTDKKSTFIRDQQPISEKVLRRSLEEGCSYEDFLLILNSRIFFWPTLSRLWKHYKRYVEEKPVIIHLPTEEIFGLNMNPLFSRLNSGATRCSSHWDGNAPERGFNTFLPAKDFEYTPAQVAEVTFEGSCKLPGVLHISTSPDGRTQKIAF